MYRYRKLLALLEAQVQAGSVQNGFCNTSHGLWQSKRMSFVAPVFLQMSCPYRSGARAEACQLPTSSAAGPAKRFEEAWAENGFYINGMGPLSARWPSPSPAVRHDKAW